MNKDTFKLIHINGRFDKKDNDLVFFHAGTGASLKLRASKFKITADFGEKNGFIYIIIDRNYEKKEKILIRSKESIVYEFNDKSEHYIDIIKCNEELDNELIIKDIEVDGEILKYDHKFDYKVKVYGDSTIAGFGILEKGGKETSYLFNDGVVNFCYRSLYNLNCEIDTFAASGWGLAFSEYTTPKTVGVFDKFNNISFFDYKEWNCHNKADLLIISLGTNDFSFISANKEKQTILEEEFFNKYMKLIEEERRSNPDLPVLMIYGALKEEQVYPLIESTYKKISKNMKNIYIQKINGDNSAFSNHSYVGFHSSMSNELTIEIKTIFAKNK